MNTIRLKTNQHRLIANLRHAFSAQSMLGELLQNARRAGATRIDVTVEDQTMIVSDDGSGIADLQTLIFIAESGWDQALQARENAFGMGVLSTLYFADQLSVYSGTQMFSAPTAAIIRGDAIEVHPQAKRIGTEIRLDGVQSPQSNISLLSWVQSKLAYLSEAFPVPLSLNGQAVPRPLTASTLAWRETPVGKVLIDLDALPYRWRCFLQGLPIGDQPPGYHRHAVLLHDDMLARLPDRQHLLNEDQDHLRIQAAVTQAYREALREAKAVQAAEAFVQEHADRCLCSGNADLLDDIDVAPLGWFRDWDMDPPGFCPFGRRHSPGVATSEGLSRAGVWRIEDGDADDLAAQAYVFARRGWLLEERALAPGHWLHRLARTISPDDVVIEHGPLLHEDHHLPLAEHVTAVLVASLRIGLAGEQDMFAVTAVRREDRLYVTDQADAVTRLISDYIVDERYCEDMEASDDQVIRTFVAIGSTRDPAQIVRALLPPSMIFNPQAKLTNAVLRLTFDDQGRLKEVGS
ncbi:ATP-binding protein [Burkholderia cepacia]|uniref:ATP-binding protein n=1 Tax=Burkholderia cepacia TaxID=292 RepID=UPI00158DEA0B|nr:ATP-binding protein [Burkholderia cepacia]